MSVPPVTYADLVEARSMISPHVLRTPVLRSARADERCGAQVFFKCENLQFTGAFKLRGAINAIARLPADQRRGGVVCYSSGNHAHAVALAAHRFGLPAVVLMPRDAPASKIAAAREWNAQVRFYDRYRDDREALARDIALHEQRHLVPSSDHPAVIAGQGTAAVELLEEVNDLDLLLVPVAGGGLLAGSTIAAATMQPHCAVVGIEPEAGNDGQLSLRSGHLVHIDTPQTIADGAQTQHLSPLAFSIIMASASEIRTVADDDLVDTLRFFERSFGMLIEPTGALAAAAVLRRRVDVSGKRVGVIVTGRNVELQRFLYLVNATSGVAA